MCSNLQSGSFQWAGKLMGPFPSHVRDGSPTSGLDTGSLLNWITSADPGRYWLMLGISLIYLPSEPPSGFRARRARRVTPATLSSAPVVSLGVFCHSSCMYERSCRCPLFYF